MTLAVFSRKNSNCCECMCDKLLQLCPTLCNSMFCWSARLLCPWDSPGKNTGVGCHALLQGIFPTEGSNASILHLLHWQVDSLPLNHLGMPPKMVKVTFK